MATRSATKVDPFKTKKTRDEGSRSKTEVVVPPADVAGAVDQFREAQLQAKHFEGEATVHKEKVLTFCQAELAKRAQNGKLDSFRVQGVETHITYITMDAGAGMSEEDVEAFAKKWGKKAAEALIVRDFHSIRFDPDVLEANYDAVVEALQTLPEDVLGKLFKPMLMKPKAGAMTIGRDFAKSPSDMQSLIKDLKLKHYVK